MTMDSFFSDDDIKSWPPSWSQATEEAIKKVTLAAVKRRLNSAQVLPLLRGHTPNEVEEMSYKDIDLFLDALPRQTVDNTTKWDTLLQTQLPATASRNNRQAQYVCKVVCGIITDPQALAFLKRKYTPHTVKQALHRIPPEAYPVFLSDLAAGLTTANKSKEYRPPGYVPPSQRPKVEKVRPVKDYTFQWLQFIESHDQPTWTERIRYIAQTLDSFAAATIMKQFTPRGVCSALGKLPTACYERFLIDLAEGKTTLKGVLDYYDRDAHIKEIDSKIDDYCRDVVLLREQRSQATLVIEVRRINDRIKAKQTSIELWRKHLKQLRST